MLQDAFHQSFCTARNVEQSPRTMHGKINARHQQYLWRLLGIKWYQSVSNTDVQRRTRQSLLISTIQSGISPSSIYVLISHGSDWAFVCRLIRYFYVFFLLFFFAFFLCTSCTIFILITIIAWTDDNIDGKKILIALPPESCKRLPVCPHITWLKTVQEDLKSDNLTLTGALDMAQHCSLWRQRSVLHTQPVQVTMMMMMMMMMMVKMNIHEFTSALQISGNKRPPVCENIINRPAI